MQTRLVVVSAIIVVAIAAGVRSQQKPSTQSQPETQKKPKLKHFGSSLDHLKWDKEKQAAVEKKGPAKTREEAEDVIRVETQLIATDVLVVDKLGRPVTGLTRNDFVIAEDSQSQPIGHFSAGSDQSVPKSIVLIIDYSASETPYMATSISAAKVLIDQLGAKDRMAIVTDDVELLVNFTGDKNKLKHALDELFGWIRLRHKRGQSKQFSALLAVARELISNEDIRPIIIFQTDGDEIGSLHPTQKGESGLKTYLPFSLSDVLLALDKSRATVYTVIPQIRLIGVPPEEIPERVRELVRRLDLSSYGFSRGYSDKSLQRIADEYYLPNQRAAAKVSTVTGGWTAFLELPEQADGIYARILADVNNRYVVGYYYPAGKPRDGKRHQFSITVKDHPEYYVAGRRSYIAPDPNP